MDRFFDEAARILAGPMPRRRAVALLGGALLAAILGAHPSAQITCTGGCPGGQKCCPGQGGANNFCILSTLNCCGNSSCPIDPISSLPQICCPGSGGGGANDFCISSLQMCCGNGNACNKESQLCCGSNCCNSGNQICCGNTVCCAKTHACDPSGRCPASIGA